MCVPVKSAMLSHFRCSVLKKPGVIFAHTLPQLSICLASNVIMQSYGIMLSWDSYDAFGVLSHEKSKQQRDVLNFRGICVVVEFVVGFAVYI